MNSTSSRTFEVFELEEVYHVFHVGLSAMFYVGQFTMFACGNKICIHVMPPDN